MIASGNKSYGIEVMLLEEGNMAYRICELEKNKSVIQINWLKEVKAIDDIKALVKKDFPVSFVVGGKGVLYKSVSDIKNPTIQQFFPGINISDFYSTIVPYKNSALGYLIRKRTVDDLIDKLSDAGINLVSITFGTSVAISAFASIEDSVQATQVNILNTKLILGAKGNAAEDTSTVNEISIGDETLPITYLLSYSAALSYYLNYEDTCVNNEKVIANSKQYKTNTLITKYSLMFLGIVLVLVMLSTGVNYYYSQQLNTLSLTVPAYANSGMRDSLIVQINKKKRFLVDGDWLTSSQSSFYADRIAASVPHGIKLTGLNIYPKQNLLAEEDDAINFDSEHLVIKGAVQDELVLKNWIEGVRTNKWIENISVTSYQWNSKTNEGEFEVKAGVKE